MGELAKQRLKERLKEIFSEIAKQYEFEIEEMSVQTDHVHLFACAPPRYSPANLANILKSISSRKMMEEFPKPPSLGGGY